MVGGVAGEIRLSLAVLVQLTCPLSAFDTWLLLPRGPFGLLVLLINRMRRLHVESLTMQAM